MKEHERHPTTYVSQEDVTKPRTFTIDCVMMEVIDNQDGKKKNKPVLYFSEKSSKPLILNRANDKILSKALGSDDENWQGQKVELFVDESIMFAGRQVGGVRVRPIPVGKVNSIGAKLEQSEEESIPF